MDTLEAKKAELEHMENRTQWRRSDQERIEALRNEVEAAQKKRPLSPLEKAKNRVHHKH